MIDFRVDLNVFRGPLDLLLYLVRKHEVEIADIPIAAITDQYLEYLAVIEQLDVNAVGDFLAMASLLIEIKSQQVLPRSDEVEDELEDPRQELVRRLLEYKKYRDAASILEERSRSWQQHYPRLSTDLPRHERDLAGEPIQEVELWDLVSAFGRIMRETEAAKPSSIVYDDTPIHVYMGRIHARLLEAGRLSFRDLFDRACTSRSWWASSWPSWSWSAITISAWSRTRCSAKSGSCRTSNAPPRWICRMWMSMNTRGSRVRDRGRGTRDEHTDNVRPQP